jgi:hypothetical protein
MSGFIASVCKADRMIHTKVGECSMFEGTPSGFIIHHKDVSFSIDTATFNAEIKAGVIAAGINRVTPLVGVVADYQITGGDVKTSQEGFSPEIPIGLNAKRVDYIIDTGGLCLLNQLKKLNGRHARIFPVDNGNIAYGTVATVRGEEKFRGFLATIWAEKRDNTGSQNGAIIFHVFYSVNYGNEEDNIGSIALDEVPEGLTGVVLKKTASGKAKFIIACSEDDLTSTYGNDLADETIYVNESGANPTGVVYTPATDDLTFTPAGKYRIADAAALYAADIEGYEGENEFTDLT